MPKGKIPLRDAISGDLKKQIDFIWSRAGTLQEQQRGDTAQGQGHCLRVEENLTMLIPDEKKKTELCEMELFVLSAAACLHDIGKAQSESGAGCALDHGVRSAELILADPDKYGLQRHQAVVVAHVVRVHNRFQIDTLPTERVPIGGPEADVITLAALFRLADMLDTSCERAPDWVGKAKYGNGNVPPKWLGREAITGWTLDGANRIILHAAPNLDELSHAHRAKAMLAEDVAVIAPYLRVKGYPAEIGELHLGDALLKKDLEQKATHERAFPGMGPYTAAMASIFKGRDAEVDRLVSCVSGWPISLLVGESGAGKTSLIQAGLFPRLESMLWRCVWTRPYDKPQQSIRGMVWRALLDGPEPSDKALWEVLRLAAEKAKPYPLLVAIDQFEEVLVCPDKTLGVRPKSLDKRHILC